MPDEKLDRIKQEINKVRKRELRMRLLKYGAVILVVILIVGYSMFWLMGHRISISGGDIVRTGSLQVGSTPAGASVSIDDKDQTYATPGQSVLDVGDHKIKLWIGTDGAYTDWQKNFTIGSDEVLWLDYATLLPTKPDTDTVANIGSSIAAINATRDAKWAVVQFGTFNQFAMLDISDPTNISVKDFSIPAASLTAADAGTAQTLKVVDTDNQSKYFLFEHDFTENGAAQHEYIYMAAADTLHAYNVTTTLNSDVTAMAFSQSSTGQFYGIDAKGNLLLLDYQKKTISAPLVRSVQSFTQFEDKITVVTVSGTGSAVGVYFNNSYTQLKVFSDNVHMPAYFARYDNTEYVAAYGDGKLCMINGPLTGPSETDVPLPDGTPALGWFNLNGNGRIIMMGSGQNVYVYDRV
ncbi:MAG: PEGA domain-containing protein, partial [Coriobacteriales bacterium]|nr:PEGA domain-containing protein [Coriobacteriales bacterium]